MPPSALAIDVPQIRRGHTEAAAEGAVEIGQVAKAASIGDRRDRLRHQPRMQQQAMREVEPLVQDIGGKAACLFLKKAADRSEERREGKERVRTCSTREELSYQTKH